MLALLPQTQLQGLLLMPPQTQLQGLPPKALLELLLRVLLALLPKALLGLLLRVLQVRSVRR